MSHINAGSDPAPEGTTEETRGKGRPAFIHECGRLSVRLNKESMTGLLAYCRRSGGISVSEGVRRLLADSREIIVGKGGKRRRGEDDW